MNYQSYQPYEPKRLYRSNDSVIFGVCGGLAEHFDLPPAGVRIAWVLLTIFAFPPLFLVMYIVMALVLKRRPVVLPPPIPGTDPFYTPGRMTYAEMLDRLQERFDALDKRLQRMESVVTRPGFGMEQKFREL
jgi:phage shock protein C